MLQGNLTLLQKLDSSEKKVVMIYLNSKKFRDFDNSDYQKLCFFLLKKCADYGKEKPPLIQEIINWSIELGRSYPSLSLEDLSLAFTLSVTGSLVWKSGEEYKNQNLDKFNWETFLTTCKVATGYIEYRRDKMKLYNRLLRDLESENESKKRSDEMWDIYVTEWKTNLYNAYNYFLNENKFDFVDTYCSYFQQLNNAGLIDLSKNEILEIKKIVENELSDLVDEKIKSIAGVELKDIKAMRSQLKIDVFKVQCCTIAIKMQFDKWIKNKVNVELLISEIKLKK